LAIIVPISSYLRAGPIPGQSWCLLSERNNEPGVAVCPSALGRFWKDGSSGVQMIRVILRQSRMAPYPLKES
jgi:hypothetical protein